MSRRSPRYNPLGQMMIRLDRLSSLQVRDLDMVHHQNLDAIAQGEADETILWQVVGGALTWSRVADVMGLGVDEMRAQLELVTRLAERFGATGRVEFQGPEYEAAKLGVLQMNELAQIVPRKVAAAAADWSEEKVNQLASACWQQRYAPIIASALWPGVNELAAACRQQRDSISVTEPVDAKERA